MQVRLLQRLRTANLLDQVPPASSLRSRNSNVGCCSRGGNPPTNPWPRTVQVHFKLSPSFGDCLFGPSTSGWVFYEIQCAELKHSVSFNCFYFYFYFHSFNQPIRISHHSRQRPTAPRRRNNLQLPGLCTPQVPLRPWLQPPPKSSMHTLWPLNRNNSSTSSTQLETSELQGSRLA